MSNFLLKIRNQPEDKKIKLLVFYTIIVLIVLFFVWYYLSGIVVGPVKYVAEENKKTSGVESVRDVFKESFSSIADGIFEAKEGFSENIK